MKQALLNRLLRYTQIYTTSDPKSQSVPSSPQQWDLLNLLKAEVESMGLTEIFLDPNGYLFATLPANTDISIPVLGLIAHVDTSPDFNGKNVKPQVIECYQGGDILLSGSGDKLSPNDFPNLNKLIGDTLVTTDGTSLLGADDKSGIAIILSAIEYLQANPQISHGKIRIGFTTDEEIGRGADHFDVKAFGADVAFTLDGGPLGELQYENFNADAAVVTFFGRSVHPGTAKGKMINALERACEFQNRLPPHLTPATSEHRKGFIMMHDIEGGVDKVEVRYILRSFEREELATFGKMLTDTIAEMQKIYGENCGKVEIIEQYRNMREVLDGYPYLIEIAEKVMREQGIEPNLEPIRGGTDGSRLSFMGLPCPNLFTGGENFHGRFEFISVDTMEKAATVVVGISTGFTKHQF
ncbi:Tripeptide aminopeptidase [Mannheimia sp. USDA-ARS-USMARC-1261]|uniref:peptidase T n=1 Tax=Mannheimia TaxID=75984 RepID=UPI0003E315CC|nr:MULTISPECIES: peptidase T [Mannheimia]AHG72620.1 Tripeptide aminopeptidase [Mannheimia sp. USDA-ARS-USMARC-1261]QLB17634.1 peptidase T [Mannheimia varigena]